MDTLPDSITHGTRPAFERDPGFESLPKRYDNGRRKVQCSSRKDSTDVAWGQNNAVSGL